MLPQNAHTLIKLAEVSRKLLRFKSPFSRDILLFVASSNGELELRLLFKLMRMTPAAVRLNVQSLIEGGYLELRQHPTNRRCKVVCLTAGGWALMREYERQIQKSLSGWSQMN